MKKENRKMAQQRRAEERRKKEFRKKLSRIIVITVPSLAVLILIIAIAVSSLSSKDTTDKTGSADSGSGITEIESQDDSDTSSSLAYSTDTSLTVADGDTVNIDYVGTIDGEEFDGGSTQGTGTDLTIGSGSYIDDFEEQLIGAHPGDTVEVNVTFPDPYELNPDMSGADAVFTVTVNGIYE